MSEFAAAALAVVWMHAAWNRSRRQPAIDWDHAPMTVAEAGE